MKIKKVLKITLLLLAIIILIIFVLVFVLKSASDGNFHISVASRELTELRKDPMVSYQPPDTTLLQQSINDPSTHGAPNFTPGDIATITRTFSVHPSTTNKKVIENIIQKAEAEGWSGATDVSESSQPSKHIYKRLPSGDAQITITEPEKLSGSVTVTLFAF